MDLHDLINEKADVLLIMDDTIYNDENDLKLWGVKRVDTFNSIVVADEYFKKHPDQLDSYDLVIRSDMSALLYMIDYSSFIDNHLRKANFANVCQNIPKLWYKESRYYRASDIIRDLLEKISQDDYAEDKEKLIKKFANKNTLPIKTELKETPKQELPSLKKDMDILWLGNAEDIIGKELGLNIQPYKFETQNMDNMVFPNLGKYDLIIIQNPDFTSDFIAFLVKQVQEQQKYTSKSLGILALYNQKNHFISNQKGLSKFPDKIDLECLIVNGNITDKKNFSYGIHALSVNDCFRAVIEGAIDVYNEELKKVNQTGLTDYNLRTIAQMSEAYNIILSQENHEAQIYQDAIDNYYKLEEAVKQLLKRNIRQLDNILITPREDNNVNIALTYNGRLIYSMTMALGKVNKNFKIIKLQKLNNKGHLSSGEDVALIENRWVDKNALPREITPDEIASFNTLANKVTSQYDLLKAKTYQRKI